MAMYTFHICNRAGVSASFEAYELRTDAEGFGKAGDLLDEHLSCDHIEIWAGDRPVLARHREQPILRPIEEAATSAA